MDNGLCSLDTAHSDWHCDAVFTVRGGSFVPSPPPPSGGRHLAAVSRQVPVRKEKAWLAPTSSCTAQQRGKKNNTKTCALSNVMGYIYIYIRAYTWNDLTLKSCANRDEPHVDLCCNWSFVNTDLFYQCSPLKDFMNRWSQEVHVHELPQLYFNTTWSSTWLMWVCRHFLDDFPHKFTFPQCQCLVLNPQS